MSTARNRTRRELEASQWEAQQKRRRNITIGAWAGAGLLFIAMLVFLVVQELRPEDLPGTEVPIQGSDHVDPGMPHDPYNSDPPTSGPHYASTAETGFYEEAPLDEYLVHNLEHGHTIIWYNCTDLSEADCTALKDDIRNVMGRAGVSLITGTPKVNAVPRPTMETTLSLTSWGRIDTFDEFDANRILAFIRAHRDNAPEPNAP
jgi:hypothetical protein